MNERPELRPCPFCGDVHAEIDIVVGIARIACGNPDCGASLEVEAQDEQQAALAWNARVPIVEPTE